MKFYFAGAETQKKSLDLTGARNVLISYYSGKNKVDDFLGYNIFLDSGAFSAFTQNKDIDIDTYIDYLNTNAGKFKLYANLDVIGDISKTKENQLYIESKGLSPLPIFHYEGDFRYLEFYAKNYDYIALGGLVPYTRQPILLKNWLNKCFKFLLPYIRNKGLKIHGLGIGSSGILTTYPFYSADSTGWLSGGKFGTIVNWIDEKMKLDSNSHYEDITTYTEKGNNLILLENYEERLKHNIGEYLKMEGAITKLWEKRGIIYGD